jgi:hypothetical protein
MSHRIAAQTVRAMVQEPRTRIDERSSILDSLQTVQMHIKTDSGAVCENPLCSARFPEGGMPQSPKRFCCDACGQQASLLRRAAVLLEGLSDDEALRILRGVK